MNQPLDPGLIAVAIVACLALVGICCWLYAAGHLDQIDRPAPTPRRDGPRRAHPPSAPRARHIRATAHEWGAHGFTPHRPTDDH